MVNNFNLIRNLLDFPTSGTFYFLQILKRRKDNPGMQGDSKVINNYFIYSLEYFDSIQATVIKECEDNNARAYMRLNKRDNRKIALQVLKKTADLIVNEDYRAVKNVYESICGEYHSDNEKKWIVDIDVHFPDNQVTAFAIAEFISKIEPLGQKVLANIPTKNGLHLITKPFNVQEFKKQYPEIDIHKDNPTVLYAL